MKSIFISLVGFMLLLVGCKQKKELSTENSVDLSMYKGTWYEIARLPNRFEKNLKCVTATYSIKENGGIKVLNKGYNTNKGKWEEAKGHAKVPNSNKPGEIKVSFFRPFYGDYYIISLDKYYQHVLVGSPSREYLWILARESSISEEVYNNYLNIAKAKKFDISKLEKTTQDCNN